MTDKAIAKEIGQRLNDLRLQKNLTQREVAEAAGLSIKAVQLAEGGSSKLLTYIKILRVLKSLNDLNAFIPAVEVSPLQLMKMSGKQRMRARKPRTKS